MIKHAGIYVSDLKKMEAFYQNVFDMYSVCQNQLLQHPLIEDLLKTDNKVRISKLITEYGKHTGVGDMIELIEMDKSCDKDDSGKIWENVHIAFGVDDVKSVVEKIILYGGERKTDIYDMGNGKLCCFCTDPEKNWLELIGQ